MHTYLQFSNNEAFVFVGHLILKQTNVTQHCLPHILSGCIGTHVIYPELDGQYSRYTSTINVNMDPNLIDVAKPLYTKPVEATLHKYDSHRTYLRCIDKSEGMKILYLY